MQPEISREIEIEAPPDAVWAVLADTDAYPDWNPFIRRLTGELRAGARIEARIAPPSGRAMTFKPTVLAAEPGRELRWLGRLLVRGLFDGEHRFALEPLADGRTRFVQSERFDGVLVRLLENTLAKTALGFEQMNAALKERVEAKVGEEAASPSAGS
jgi:hypothetical protein